MYHFLFKTCDNGRSCVHLYQREGFRLPGGRLFCVRVPRSQTSDARLAWPKNLCVPGTHAILHERRKIAEQEQVSMESRNRPQSTNSEPGLRRQGNNAQGHPQGQSLHLRPINDLARSCAEENNKFLKQSVSNDRY